MYVAYQHSYSARAPQKNNGKIKDDLSLAQVSEVLPTLSYLMAQISLEEIAILEGRNVL